MIREISVRDYVLRFNLISILYAILVKINWGFTDQNEEKRRSETTIHLKDFPFDNKTLLGIDYGHKKTGLATFRWSIDPCPTPYETIFENRIDKLIPQIMKIIEDEVIEAIILGLPTHADGSDSESTKKVRKFQEKLELHTNLPIFHQDERLTSKEAQRRIDDSHLEPGQFRDGYVDQLAASIILEDFVQKVKSLG